MKIAFLPIVTGILAIAVFAQNGISEDKMIKNGSFEMDSDHEGMADHWQFSGDSGVIASWERDKGFDGQFSQKIVCTSYDHISPASHAMLCQLNTIELEKRKWYKISFSAKQKNIKGRSVQLAISNTKSWSNCGLQESFRVSQDWKHFSFTFQANQTITDNTRLQFWYNTTGAFWLDNVRLEHSEPVIKRFTETTSQTDAINLIPNSNFECGASGWGSISKLPGWGGNLNQLVGNIDESNSHFGESSFRIDLNFETIPIYHFDYFPLYRIPVKAPLLANRGWIAVEKDVDYTLSAYMKADSDGLQGILSVRQAFRGNLHHNVSLTSEWKRYDFTFRSQANQIFIALGADLELSKRDSGTVWIDAVQLEKGNGASKYYPRAKIEIGLDTDRVGNIFHCGAEPIINMTVSNADDSPHSIVVKTHITDFDDKLVCEISIPIELRPNQSSKMPIHTSIDQKGFYRLNCAIESNDDKVSAEVILTRSLRLAVIEPYTKPNSIFGMNHAYPWQHLLDLSKEIGLLWFRDWSLKWQDVESEKGEFDFRNTDFQIDRVLERGLNVLPLLPFPSSNWSSSSEQKPETTERYPNNRELMAYMPRDLEEFADYVRATVNHYRERLHVWEILNEPIFTDYALPRAKGNTVEDYVSLLKVAYKAVKESDPNAIVIGGIAGGADTYTREFINAGGLDFVDALNLHIYPGLTAPEEYEEPLAKLRELMRKNGKDIPIWFTEGAYYADDDTPVDPFSEWLKPLGSEAEAAEWQVKFNIILMAYGVEKIIYHSGTPGSLNNESLSGIFFEWAGEPRKMLVTQSVMSNIFSDTLNSFGKIHAPEKVKAYRFESNSQTAIVAWMEEGAESQKVTIKNEIWRVLDLQGNEIKGDEVILTERPVYFISNDRELDSPL